MKIALCLTLARILLGPIFLCGYLYHESLGITMGALPYILLAILGVSELADLFDGIFARRMNQVTELGKLIDPMADSMFRITVLFTFTAGPVGLPLLLVSLFFYRDALISTLRTVCALRGVALAARTSGKIKAILLVVVEVGVLLLMIPYSMGIISLDMLQNISFYMVLGAAVYTIGSAVEYLVANRSYILKALV